ncbi:MULTISPECIES: DUF3343 domain-containing protein [unclassified Adlercreutzia]|uniref:DUF3343 domain-containing protein n=1 Tax=unclassified Adlercreutzia TaxID=2636013 RepID=UPI0013EC634D|nr:MULTISPECIES: DUF3343 domain-containing protein [unclassified Adlercreutzia]
MGKATPHVVATFYTTTAALAMQKAGVRHGLRGRLAPIPRQLSAGCGFAWREPAEGGAEVASAAADAVRAVLEAEGIEAEGVVLLDL